MAICIAFDELEGPKTRKKYTGNSGTNQPQAFTYLHPFGLYFNYRHQNGNINNRINVSIYLKSKSVNMLWIDHDFDWYIAM